MFCCRKKPKEQTGILGPLSGISNLGFKWDDTSSKSTENNLYEVHLPTKKPGHAVKTHAVPETTDQGVLPDMQPQPNSARRNQNQKTLPNTQEEGTTSIDRVNSVIKTTCASEDLNEVKQLSSELLLYSTFLSSVRIAIRYCS